MRLISVMLIVLLLSACSSSSSDSSSESASGADGSSSVKRPSDLPELDLVKVAWTQDFQPIPFNAQVEGVVYQDDLVTMKFHLAETAMVALVLTSTARNADLYVQDETGDILFDSESESSDEAILFTAQANVRYIVSLLSREDNGTFDLKLLSPRRDVVKINDRELFFVATGEGSRHCLSNSGIRETLSVTGQNYSLVYDTQTRRMRHYGSDAAELVQESFAGGTRLPYSGADSESEWTGEIRVNVRELVREEEEPELDEEENADEPPPLKPEHWVFYGNDSRDTDYYPVGPIYTSCIGQIEFASTFIM